MEPSTSGVRFVASPRGVTVLRDGFQQSHVDLADPTNLTFEYIQQMAAVIDVHSPARPGERLAVTHVGGAGFTLARWVQHTRPGSPQIVLEPDAAMTELVRRELPLPRGHRIRVRAVEGGEGLGALRPGSADVVVLDAYDQGRVPGHLVTLERFTQIASVLAAGGLLLANVADEPGFRYAARVAAGMREAVGPVSVVSTHDILKGRRFGNLVLAASSRCIDPDDLLRAMIRLPIPAGAWDDVTSRSRLPGALAMRDADPVDSPEPPRDDAWRRI